jgi:hypothetical protein
MAACNSQDSGKSTNVLTGNETNIWYVAGLDNSTTPAEWISDLDLNKLYEIAFKPILSGEFEVHSPNQHYFTANQVSLEKIHDNLGWENNSKKFDDLKELFFHEKWSLSNNLKSFEKDIVYWCPVRVWKPRENSDDVYKRKCFYVKPKSDKKGTLVGKSVFTEFDFSNPTSYPYWYGFDPHKFTNLILDNIQKGDLKVYDPVYIVDKSTRELDAENLEKLIGESLNADNLRKNIWSFIFEENWYIDQASLNIYKDVKSIGFVKKYWENGEQKSKILFFWIP